MHANARVPAGRPAGRTAAVSDTGVAHSTNATLKYDGPCTRICARIGTNVSGSIQCLPAAAQKQNWKRMQHAHAFP